MVQNMKQNLKRYFIVSIIFVHCELSTVKRESTIYIEYNLYISTYQGPSDFK